MYQNKLFDEIIVSNSYLAAELNVITGYSSPTFIKKVIQLFPDLTINIYIGMASEGISYTDHERYVSIQKTSKVRVFYQKNDVMPATHIKLLYFKYKNLNDKIFVGSANFSENGFEKNREIMIQSLDIIPESYFDWQKKHSIICDSEQIDHFVNFFHENQTFVHTTLEKPEQILEPFQNNQQSYSGIQLSKINRNNLDFINHSYLWRQYEKIETPLVLPRENDVHFDITGVNAWVEGNKPYIKEGSLYRFRGFFPNEITFNVYTDDGYCFEAILKGRFGRELHFLDVDISDYFKLRLGKLKKEIISIDDLSSYGRAKLTFYKVKENKFILDFSLVS